MSTTVKLPDDLMNQLNTFDKNTDEIVGKALTAGAKIAEARVRKNLNAVLSGESSGQLQQSLGVSPVKIGGKNNSPSVRVGFAEPRRDGKANAMVANILEYGSKKHNQSAKPFMKPAADSTKSAAKAEIRRVFDEEAKKYLKMKG